jgi:hypothetical protein
MKQRPCWEANSRSASHEFSHLLRSNRKVHYCVHKVILYNKRKHKLGSKSHTWGLNLLVRLLLGDINIYLLTLQYLVSEVVQSKDKYRHKDEDCRGENPIRRAHTNTSSIVPGLHTFIPPVAKSTLSCVSWFFNESSFWFHISYDRKPVRS